MNWQTIESGWKNCKASTKQQWGKLQEAYGIGNEETERQISDWQSRQRELRQHVAK